MRVRACVCACACVCPPDLQARVSSAEAALQERGVLVEALEAKLVQAEQEKSQLEDQVGSIHVLLEASQSREEDDGHVVRR